MTLTFSVRDKWGDTGPYVRFEIESAMREFLDCDDRLADAEDLLGQYLDAQGLSSSTEALTWTADHSDTIKLGHRVNAKLKDEFTSVANTHFSDSLGAVLAHALNAYRDGGRARRILEDVKQLVTGGASSGTTAVADESVSEPRQNGGASSGTTVDADERTTNFDESGSGSAGPSSGTTVGPDESGSELRQNSGPSSGTTTVTDERTTGPDERSSGTAGTSSGTTVGSDERVAVEPHRVVAIADELPDEFPAKLLEATIRETVGDSDAAVEAYTEPVVDYANVVEHPHQSGLYISATRRQDSTFWCDLNRELRAARLRRLVVLDAFESNTQLHKIDYKKVMELFETNLCEGPSHDYAYTLMEDAAKLDGFQYGYYRGQKQLRVDVQTVKQEIVDDVLEENPYLDPDELTVNGLITGYTAGVVPRQEGVADD